MSLDTRLYLAKYNKMTNDEKDQFCLNYIDKHYHEVSYDTKVFFTHLSRYVSMYMDARNKQERDFLWHHYDSVSQFMCDPIKWETIYKTKF